MEFIIAGVITGLAILIALHQFVSRHLEAQNVEFLSDRLLEAADDLLEEQHAHRFWLLRSGEESRQVGAAHGDLEIARTEAEELESAVDFLMEKVVDLVDEVGELEEELEDAEEETDDWEEMANEGLAGWTKADAISTRALDLVERLLDRIEEEN
ncbi:hypothetical protein LCGC14_1575740 [marine sediment metagenome]|uniref:Uncharacterized protein n=1 Tax=marine sediment metagenome TaxID=412755 RepID=A0A0F9IIB2_9ZZZZ